MFDQNRVLKGTNGYVWLDGELLSEIKKIEIKITGNFEGINVCGSYATYPIYTGWSGDGTLTLQKIDSKVLRLLGNAFKDGVMPEIKIITKLEDSRTKKSERTAITGVVLTEFNLANMESNELIEETVPIQFSDYEILETI